MNTDTTTPAALNPPHSFELNERVKHAEYGTGNIRGFVHSPDGILWLVRFDCNPTIDTPDGAVAVPQLFPVATRNLQKA